MERFDEYGGNPEWGVSDRPSRTEIRRGLFRSLIAPDRRAHAEWSFEQSPSFQGGIRKALQGSIRIGDFGARVDAHRLVNSKSTQTAAGGSRLRWSLRERKNRLRRDSSD